VKKASLLVLLFIVPLAFFAQTGKITGKVISASSGQGLSNATLILIERSKTEVADQNGNFSFGRLPAGTYSLKCSYAGLAEKIISEINVKDGESIPLTISLEEKILGGVTLNATPRPARVESVSALLNLQKNLANVADGVTAEQFRKTSAKTSSDVIKMVSGASIQDDRFAVVRGLNDRYNAAFINGSPLPSTESDRKAFAFDIFPSAILDNLVIYKTATPDKTGEFAGGIIDITTKSTLSKGFTSINFGGSYNSISTGKTRYYSENKGKKDWIGVDDGTRAFPAGIPSARVLQNTADPAAKANFARLFNGYRWGVLHADSKPNYNFQLTRGFNIEKDQREFIGVLLSLNYNRNYTTTTGKRDGWEYNTFQSAIDPEHRANYADSVYNDEVVVAALSNIAVKINKKNSISWKNNLSVNTDNKLIKRIGVADITSDPTSFNKDVVRSYTSNKIFSSQLGVENLVGNKKTKINWLASYSKVNRDIPNLSRTSYTGTYPDVTYLNASITQPPSQTSGSGTMFFSTSNENIKSIKTDIIQPYTWLKNSQNNVKIGGGYQIRKRDFTSRVVGFNRYVDNLNGISYDNSLSSLPEDQIYLPEHIGVMKNGKGGFLLNDGTLSNSDYDASSVLTHAYIMDDQRFLKKFRLIFGARIERFNQKLNSIKNQTDTININSVVTDYLPSTNLVYAVTPKMNLRLSYSKTINRPEFRELAPFLFFEYQTSFLIEGNPGLKRALIDNYDFRYEFYPGRAQLFSVSAFYKGFVNPIELVSLPNTSAQTYYQNAKTAKVYGIEAEFRTLISTLFGIKGDKNILSKFTLAANGAYIKSNVKLDSISLIAASLLATDRALQGQSPYIINASLGFNDDKTGLTATISGNRVGDRIFVAGTYNTADLYEKARTVMDFQLGKSFLNNAIEIKFTAKDIIAQNINFYYDFDKSKGYSDYDKYFSSFKAPKTYSVSATFKF
jgi:TonB-dependent receptor